MSLTHQRAICFMFVLCLSPLQAALGDSEVDRLVSKATPDSTDVVVKLRKIGPTALDALFSRRDGLQRRLAQTRVADDAAALERQLSSLDQVIDLVGGQRYCTRSRLYWYTDLDEAKAAASAAGKPILSLRMLGNLTDELSCANSRFFRTTLYANADIAKFLRERFILHWQSVRPVPVVTIDFGDGRKLRRTLTGNSIHYVLTSRGEIVDALPGLYGPAAFLEKLTRMADVARQTSDLPIDGRAAWLAEYHRQQLQTLAQQWQRDWQQVTTANAGLSTANTPVASRADGSGTPAAAAAPAAVDAGRIARPKGAVEMPVLRGIAAVRRMDPDNLDDEATWQSIAALHGAEARLDAASRDLIASENPNATAAGKLSITKRLVEDPMLRLVRNLEASIAVDTVRNEYQLHRRIHQWLSDPAASVALESFNDRVYAELFLTPKSDPWLGLAPADAYTAITNAGVVPTGKDEARH